LYYCQNHEQTIHVLASESDGWWFNEVTEKAIDLDHSYSVDCIKEIVYDIDERKFFFLANNKNGKIGFFMTCFEELNPLNYTNMTLCETSLEIEDAKLEIMRTFDEVEKVYSKELVITYKTIFINTYNVQIYDLSAPIDKQATLYIHESFQLWEN
jgi:hypothetical protein